MTKRVYLDYNATALPRPEALAAAMTATRGAYNASSVHAEGRAARKMVEDARAQVAALVNVPPAQIIFNSGATEGNNTVLKYFADGRVLVSAIEHPSVLEVLSAAEKIPVTADGVVDLVALEKMLQQKKTTLVSVMMVNNETGAIQPVADISALVKKHGALFHCDAAQAAGRIKTDMAAVGIDFLTLSAHKIGGPQGMGALALGICGVTPVLLEGGGQEKKARAGTENVAGIAGFGAAAQAALAGMEAFQKLSLLRDRLEAEVAKISPEAVFHARAVPRVSNTSMFSLPGALSETLLMAFDLEGVALSNGSACSSGTVRASHVLKAMDVADETAKSALRVSMGWATQESDIDRFLEVWSKIYGRMKNKTKEKAHA